VRPQILPGSAIVYSGVRDFGAAAGLEYRMRNVISVMNAKGGVGKSTLVLTMAETLSADHSKKVLVIDSDAHASISAMLASSGRCATIEEERRTFVDYLIAAVLTATPVSWPTFVVSRVSDVNDARSIDLLHSGGRLTLLEREVSKLNKEAALRRAIRAFLAEAREVYDIVMIDCAPGLSVLTECWLREAGFYLSPAKPDYISTRGLQFIRQFRQRDAELGFAENLGVVISMKDQTSLEDEEFDRWLRRNIKNRCFEQTIPRAVAFQAASHYSERSRSYGTKYPDECGRVLRALAAELLGRLEATQTQPRANKRLEHHLPSARRRVQATGSRG
jgi:chromosome partitioning protein